MVKDPLRYDVDETKTKHSSTFQGKRTTSARPDASAPSTPIPPDTPGRGLKRPDAVAVRVREDGFGRVGLLLPDASAYQAPGRGMPSAAAA